MRLVRRTWIRLRSLNSAEWRLLLAALPLVAVCRLGLWVLPFETLRRLVEKVAVARGRGWSKPAEAARAVRIAARWIPRASCLVQALALRILLARTGHNARLHIGVAFKEGRKFDAHAWVETQEGILIGGSDSRERYAPLAVWEGKRVTIDGSNYTR